MRSQSLKYRWSLRSDVTGVDAALLRWHQSYLNVVHWIQTMQCQLCSWRRNWRTMRWWPPHVIIWKEGKVLLTVTTHFCHYPTKLQRLNSLFNQNAVEIKALKDNYLSLFYMDVITHPFPIPDTCLTNPSLLKRPRLHYGQQTIF